MSPDPRNTASAESRRARGEELFDRADFERAAERVLRDYMASVDDPFAVAHRLQVSSFGGSGTTALRDHLLEAGLDLPRGPDSWPFKHARVPPDPARVPDGFRAIYVYGDPRDATRSIFRRGLQYGHYSLLHVDRPDANPEAVAGLRSLERYTERGIDEFGLREHFENWSNATGYPVLLLRFDSLPTTWSTVREFVGLPDHCPPPVVLDRQSDVPDDSDDIWRALTAMYTELIERIESMPSVVIHD